MKSPELNTKSTLSLISLILKRWREEPVGIAFAILIFLMFSIPEQVPDMLHEVMIFDGEEFRLEFASLDETLMFLLLSGFLATTTWFWMFAVNRAEVTLKGGRIESDKFLSWMREYRYSPFRLACFITAMIVFWSAVFALFKTPDGFVLIKGIAILAISIACVAFSNMLTLRAVQANDHTAQTHLDAYKKVDLRRLNEAHQSAASLARITMIFRASPFWIIRAGILALAIAVIFGFVAVYVLPTIQSGTSHTWVQSVAVYAILVIGSFCTAYVPLFYAFNPIEKSNFRRPLKWALIVTALATLAFTLGIRAEGFDYGFMGSTPIVLLLAIAASIGPLTLILALVRDICELIINVILNLEKRIYRRETWTGLHMYTWVRSGDGVSANVGRRVARAVGLVICAVVFFGAPLKGLGMDCHEDETCPLYSIRLLPAHDDQVRPNLVAALKEWAEPLVEKNQSDAEPPDVPILIVATEGGASRAAAWTVAVLDDLASDSDAKFHEKLFAISSVSGGSLGAATYAYASWNQAEKQCGDLTLDGVDALAGADLLNASIARFFLTDVLRRSPLGYFMSGVDDRNTALEKTFERHWDRSWGYRDPALSKMNADKEPRAVGMLEMRSLASQKANCPPVHLLINGTDTASGQRLVTSTLSLKVGDAKKEQGADKRTWLLNGISFFDDVNADVRLSTAVMNSARFPFISPAGKYPIKRDDENLEDSYRQIVDGGYYENFGVETAMELIRAIEDIDSSELDFKPVPYLLVISNSSSDFRPPALTLETTKEETKEIEADWAKKTVLTCSPDALDRSKAIFDAKISGDDSGQSLVPVLSLLATRPAHGFRSLLGARAHLCQDGKERFYHFALQYPVNKEKHAAPFNWVLYEKAREFIADAALKKPLFQDQRKKLLHAISP